MNNVVYKDLQGSSFNLLSSLLAGVFTEQGATAKTTNYKLSVTGTQTRLSTSEHTAHKQVALGTCKQVQNLPGASFPLVQRVCDQATILDKEFNLIYTGEMNSLIL